MAEDADLLSLGTHCSLAECKRLDFLPFHCSHCSQVFCLDHRTPASHKCSQLGSNDVHVPVCPICNHIIKKSKNEDINSQVERHILSGCKSLVVAKPKKSNKCSLKTCRQHGLMPFVCPECNKNHCVRHRHAEDHFCSALQVPLVTCA
ncbi:AN1-type zinc finger protein 2B-like isoform X1 [Acropora muricata]|uniref:AN1-type zinc finger protein 2B-like isoform X1 n=1 Tax=Acropora muricata TaxID=159855 RepID=UPI0034E566FB